MAKRKKNKFHRKIDKNKLLLLSLLLLITAGGLFLVVIKQFRTPSVYLQRSRGGTVETGFKKRSLFDRLRLPFLRRGSQEQKKETTAETSTLKTTTIPDPVLDLPFDEIDSGETPNTANPSYNGSCDESSGYCPSLISNCGGSENCLQFDGVDDRIEIADHNLIDFEDGENFTISYWFKTTDNSSELTHLSKGAGGVHYAIGYHSDWGDHHRIKLDDGSSDIKLETRQGWFDDSWHLIVIVYEDDNNLTLYEYNDVESSLYSNTHSGTIGSMVNSDSLFVGEKSGNYFNGSIDEVKIWDQVLSEEQVCSLAGGSWEGDPPECVFQASPTTEPTAEPTSSPTPEEAHSCGINDDGVWIYGNCWSLAQETVVACNDVCGTEACIFEAIDAGTGQEAIDYLNLLIPDNYQAEDVSGSPLHKCSQYGNCCEMHKHLGVWDEYGGCVAGGNEAPWIGGFSTSGYLNSEFFSCNNTVDSQSYRICPCISDFDSNYDKDGDGFSFYSDGDYVDYNPEYIEGCSGAVDCSDPAKTYCPQCIYPGAPEICDGIDNNIEGVCTEDPQLTCVTDNDCNGLGSCDLIDEGLKSTYYQDADGDGYGNPDISRKLCEPVSGYVNDNTDCNDEYADCNPGIASENETTGGCYDGRDNDCDGLIDNNDVSDCVSAAVLEFPLDDVQSEGSGEKTIDASGTGNDGILGDGTCTEGTGLCPALITDQAQCIQGNCFYFDGVDDYIEVINDDSIDFENEDFTIAYWFKSPSSSSDNFHVYKSSYYDFYKIGYNNTADTLQFKLGASVTDNAELISSLSGNDWFNDKWHFVTVVYDDDQGMKMYKDGFLENSNNSQLGGFGNNNSLFFGKGDGEYYQGFMDNIRIFQGALSDGEVCSLSCRHEEGNELTCNDGIDNDCDGLVDMDDIEDCAVCGNTGEDDWDTGNVGDGCDQCDNEGDQDGDQTGDWSVYPGMVDQCDSDCGTVVNTLVDVGDYEDNHELTCNDGKDNDCDGLIDSEEVSSFEDCCVGGECDYWHQEDSVITGLTDGTVKAYPAIFEKDGVVYMIYGDSSGTGWVFFEGYRWEAGSGWVSDSGITDGLGLVGDCDLKPTVFNKDGTWYLIHGAADDVTGFWAYSWDEDQDKWIYDASGEMIDGLVSTFVGNAPKAFELNGEWYLISINNDPWNEFWGYKYSDAEKKWQANSDIVKGLGNVIPTYDSSPMIFKDGDDYYLIVNWENSSGEIQGIKIYKWEGSDGWKRKQTDLGLDVLGTQWFRGDSGIKDGKEFLVIISESSFYGFEHLCADGDGDCLVGCDGSNDSDCCQNDDGVCLEGCEFANDNDCPEPLGCTELVIDGSVASDIGDSVVVDLGDEIVLSCSGTGGVDYYNYRRVDASNPEVWTYLGTGESYTWTADAAGVFDLECQACSEEDGSVECACDGGSCPDWSASPMMISLGKRLFSFKVILFLLGIFAVASFVLISIDKNKKIKNKKVWMIAVIAGAVVVTALFSFKTSKNNNQSLEDQTKRDRKAEIFAGKAVEENGCIKTVSVVEPTPGPTVEPTTDSVVFNGTVVQGNNFVDLDGVAVDVTFEGTETVTVEDMAVDSEGNFSVVSDQLPPAGDYRVCVKEMRSYKMCNGGVGETVSIPTGDVVEFTDSYNNNDELVGNAGFVSGVGNAGFVSGDGDDNNTIDFNDLLELGGVWGDGAYHQNLDFDNDGDGPDFNDLLVFAGNYEKAPIANVGSGNFGSNLDNTEFTVEMTDGTNTYQPDFEVLPSEEEDGWKMVVDAESVPGGSYTVKTKEMRSLEMINENVMINPSDVLEIECGEVIAGDVNNDGDINMQDFSQWAGIFNAGFPDYDIKGDLNNDGSITMVDFSIFAGNFGKTPVVKMSAGNFVDFSDPVSGEDVEFKAKLVDSQENEYNIGTDSVGVLKTDNNQNVRLLMESETIPDGTYDIYVKEKRSEWVKEESVVVSSDAELIEIDFGEVKSGDGNDDGVINTTDFSVWIGVFGNEGYEKRADFNNDGVVNTTDFSVWIGNFQN